MEAGLLQAGERLDEVNFRLNLMQKTNGMTFGTDALLLAAFVRALPRGEAIEFGAGSGIISLLCATRNKFAHITAVEVQKEYADLCRRNVRLNNLETKITVCHADLRDTKQYAVTGEVTAVFANPPYMTASSGYQASDSGRQAARHEMNGTIADFCLSASKKLRSGGSFYVVWRPDRITDLFCALRSAKLEPKRLTFVSQSTKIAPSMLLLEARRDGKPGVVTSPLFYLQNQDGTNTEELHQLLTDGSFPY